ncbi:MAG: alpha/beta hydrolase [Ruminococcaceae bacterium]|nr:alpha/beta hydrolase [Oscillospiraceae bacterium]
MPHFTSSEGKKQIYYEIIEPKSKPKAVIQVVHGMCEYFGRYKEFSDFMVGNGYAVAGDDHLGHGRTAEKKEDQGFFAKNNGWRFLVRDEKRMTEILKEKFPDTPIILFGHSMGSFIARLYTSWYSEDIAAALFMGTSSGVPAGAAGAAVRLLENAAGTKTQLQTGQEMFYHFLTRRVSDKTGEMDWISRDKEKTEFFKNDPLGNFAFTAGAYRDLVKLLNEVSAKEWAYSLPKDLPVMLMSGEEDPIGDYGKGTRRVYRRLVNAGMKNVAIRLYVDARHELINEINRKEVYEDILNWTEKVLENVKK